MNHIEILRTAMLRIVQDAHSLAQAENIAHVALAATAEPEQDEPDFWWNGLKEKGVISETETTNADIPLFAGHNPQSNMILDLTAQLAAMTAQYQELIYQVGKKYPGESRHQTALRYLGQAEQDDTDYSVAAIAATKVEQIERP